MTIDVAILKQLREETGAGVLEIKQALENAFGDFEKAKKELIAKGTSKAAKKSERETKDGLVYSYIHGTGKVGSMVVVACETDFVARTDAFKKLCHEVALQVVSGDYPDVQTLVDSPYIRDENKKVVDLVTETIAKLGEKIEIKKFVKLSVN